MATRHMVLSNPQRALLNLIKDEGGVQITGFKHVTATSLERHGFIKIRRGGHSPWGYAVLTDNGRLAVEFKARRYTRHDEDGERAMMNQPRKIAP